jgi:hypothetical protein
MYEEVKLHVFLASILDGIEWSNSHASHFTKVLTGEEARWVPKLMEPKLLPLLGSESRSPACCQSV